MIDETYKFSIIIPTWNNFNMLKLCVNSIQKHSYFKHQIIIYINESKDEIRKWAEENKLTYSFSENNVGVCVAVNSAAKLALTDYIVYFNDDMYACPNWDFYLWEEIQQQPDTKFFLSSTAIEPRDVGKKIAIAPHDFGRDAKTFKEEDLLQQYATFPKTDWNGASWPPNVVHRSLWEQVGGYSEEFSPGFYSDPDFSMKLWQVGVRRFKGVGKSRVYHFLEVSTTKLKTDQKNNGRKIFLKKWGITSRVFYRYYLRMGSSYVSAPLRNPRGIAYYLDRIICIFKKIL